VLQLVSTGRLLSRLVDGPPNDATVLSGAWDLLTGLPKHSTPKVGVPPRPCENHFAGPLGARLIQTARRSRIKDSPRLRLRFYCCLRTKASSVFTQPAPPPAVRPGRAERRICAALPPSGCPRVYESNRPSTVARFGPPRRQPMPISGHPAYAVPLVWPARWATLHGRAHDGAALHTPRAVGTPKDNADKHAYLLYGRCKA